MRQITLGVLAHVDAGKTTLCEGLLFHNKMISSFGRVDKGESFLDYEPLERKRGITIYSKQAVIREPNGSVEITLLDTPGHVDFVWETLSCMEVMDAALLVIDASSPLLPHTIRLFKLLKQNGIPVILFMNKMDLATRSNSEIMSGLEPLGSVFADFSLPKEELWENISLCDEELLESYLETGELTDRQIQKALFDNKFTPVFFGVATKNEGVEELNRFLCDYVLPKAFSGDGFLPFKEEIDDKGQRLVHGRILQNISGGMLRPKDLLMGEKVEEIRRYSGEKFESVKEATPGMLVALRGPENIALSIRGDAAFNPLVEYEMVLNGVDSIVAMQKLFPLTIEHPALKLRRDNRSGQILLAPMGDIQLEILKDIIKDRFDLEVEFRRAGVIYKETVAGVAEGVGHFEPLRHYSECHVIIEPNPDKGIDVVSALDVDSLASNWQNQILSALKNHVLRGTAIGAELTDVKITLVAGRSHEKHTEGGDFREAAHRAYRQGLMKAGCRILEPLYAFELRIPSDSLGKIMARLETMDASFGSPEYQGDDIILKGSFPVSMVGDFPAFTAQASSGHALLSMGFGGYIPAKNKEEILAESTYNPEADLAHPADSVFTSHGASVIIPWYEVEEYMHLPLVLKGGAGLHSEEPNVSVDNAPVKKETGVIGLEEIESILNRAVGSNKRAGSSDRRSHWNRYNRNDVLASHGHSGDNEEKQNRKARQVAERLSEKESGKIDNYLLVDGYNIIFAWEYLSELSKDNLDSAKDLLTDILSEYAGFTGNIVILVFDAYRVAGGRGSILRDRGIDVVHTREAQTADAYIEKTSHELSKKHNVRVATSDRLEQMIVWGDGAIPMSAMDLYDEIKRTKAKIEDAIDGR